MKPVSLPPDDRRPVLQPPRFGLLTLFAGVAILGSLFAITHYFGGYGTAIAILFTLCVIAHVVGNALGTKLRAFGDQPLRADGTPAGRAPPPAKPAAEDFAPLTRLSARHSLGKRIMAITATGTLLGGLFGFFIVHWLADDRTPWHVFGMGIAACAVLGGIWTFAAASFLQVTLGEFWHAHRNSS